MRNKMRLLAIAAALLGCSSNWKLKETKSEMDDGVRYSVVTESEREQKNEKGEAVRSFLAVTFEKNATTIRSGPGQVIRFTGRTTQVDGARVATGAVKVRFDDEDPMQAEMVEMPNMNGRFVYLGPNEADLLRKMLAHKTMKIQWVLEFSGTPIDTFKLDGLKDALLKLCDKAPAGCTADTPIGVALASVGVEIAGGEASASDIPRAPKPQPPKATATPAAPRTNGLALPVGTFASTTVEWKACRDAAVEWCGVNAGKCTNEAVGLLKQPADGVLEVGGGGAATLTTCSPGNCPAVTLVELKRLGADWSVTKVEWSAMGD